MHERKGNEKFVILGTDGFWEGITIASLSNSLSTLCDECNISNILEDIFVECKAKVEDNLTVLLVKL